MGIIAPKTLTLEEFLQLPETEPASEYIDDQIVQKTMPQGKHSAIQSELTPTINATLKPKKIARAFTELRCTFGGRSIVPDISVFPWDNIPRDEKGEVANTFLRAPDWSIKILSPDQNQTKVTKNILHCLKHGTRIGWLIDPAEQTVFVYFQGTSIEVFDDPDAVLPVPKFAGEFRLTLGELFAWLT
jgi:Uma2 family endonuclease